MAEIISQLAEVLRYLFSWSGLWVWLVVALTLGVILYVRPHPFWLTDLIYRFPVVGKMARYSKDHGEEVAGGWLNVELTLCGDYAGHVASLSRVEFENHIEYLRKAQELGRNPLPWWAWPTITLLVAFEGLAFAYILGSWISIDSSENQRELFMLAIVAVLAILLVILTHKAGSQLYRTKLLQSCFRAWKEKRGPHFFSRPVALTEKQSVDDAEPPYVQCTNRVATRHGDFGGSAWVWAATIFVLVIAVGATWLRVATLDSSNDVELLENIFGDIGGAAPTPGSNRTAAFVSFAMLAAIFIITQVVAVGLGYNFGFAGRESLDAHNETGGHPNYHSYWRPIQRRMDIANSRLQSLQRMLEQGSAPIDWKYNFYHYIRRARDEGNSGLRMPPDHTDPPPTDPAAKGEASQRDSETETNITPFERGTK